MLVWKQIGKVTTLIKWECDGSSPSTSTWGNWLHNGSILPTSTKSKKVRLLLRQLFMMENPKG